MVNKSKWIYNYCNLDPNNQLIVADAIIEELRTNEVALDEDEYDHKKSEIIRELFYSIKSITKESEQFKKYSDIIEKYENLSEDNKKNATDEILKVINEYVEIQEQEDNEEICSQKGHTFGKWVHNKWIEYEDMVIDHELVPNCPIHCSNWERTCSRCGCIESTDKEPQELINKRKERNKKARIMRLEKTLAELKGEE